MSRKNKIGLEWLESQSQDLFCERPIIEDQNHLKFLQDMSNSRINEYKTGFAVTPVGSWKINPYLHNHPELFDYIEKRTYPYDEPIGASWMKWYGAGHFAGMHQDQFGTYAQQDRSDSLWYITTILIDNKDLVGGEVVIAGDTNFSNQYVIAERMKVLNITTPGNGACWNQYTLHGIAEIKSGERVTLMIAKRSKESKQPFQIKQQPKQ